MKVFEAWTVYKCPKCDNFRCFYTGGETLEEAGYVEDDIICSCTEEFGETVSMVECKPLDWTPEIFVSLINNELEDRNMFDLRGFPERLQEKISNLPYAAQSNFLQIVSEALFEQE